MTPEQPSRQTEKLLARQWCGYGILIFAAIMGFVTLISGPTEFSEMAVFSMMVAIGIGMALNPVRKA